MVKVTGEDSGKLVEKILRHHDAPDVAEVGSECELSLKIPRQSFICCQICTPKNVSRVGRSMERDDGCRRLPLCLCVS